MTCFLAILRHQFNMLWHALIMRGDAGFVLDLVGLLELERRWSNQNAVPANRLRFELVRMPLAKS